MDFLWNNIVDNAGELFLILKTDGEIIFINEIAIKMLEYKREEIIGENLSILFMDKNFNIEEVINKSREETQIINAFLYKHNQTGFNARLRIVYDGEANLVYCYINDQTELEKVKKDMEFAAGKAKEADKNRNEFVANVTHELRTPVNGIKGHTQYLMMTEHTNDQDKELKIIRECCSNMEALINNILDFSKLESGKFTISEREFNFKEFLNFISETNGKLIEDKGLRFILHADQSIPERLVGDDFRLTQILNNLLSNAKKFTEKGYVAVEITRTMQFGRDIELFFMVMDTGIGVKPEKKEAIFESFSQADASITRSFGGTGLGLTITRQLVELMHGSISLESEFGKGSSFTFTVRMKLPEDVQTDETNEIINPIKIDHSKLAGKLQAESDKMANFGSLENIMELQKLAEKISLCIELLNFQKAEGFADSIKSLVASGVPELKSLAFRMQMSIRKEDSEGATKYLNELAEVIKRETGKDILS